MTFLSSECTKYTCYSVDSTTCRHTHTHTLTHTHAQYNMWIEPFMYVTYTHTCTMVYTCDFWTQTVLDISYVMYGDVTTPHS